MIIFSCEMKRMCAAGCVLDIVAEMDDLLHSHEATEPADLPSTDKTFNRMSLNMASHAF
jgi:hypothetical protein